MARAVFAAVTSITFSESNPDPCSIAFRSISRKAVISRSRSSSGSAAWYSSMKRTSRSAVSRWLETRMVNQSGRPEVTSMPSRQPVASSARADHVHDLGIVERRREAGEDVRAQRRDHLFAARLGRQHDDAHAGAERQDFARQRQVLGHRGAGIGEHDVDRVVADPLQRLDAARATLDVVGAQPRVADERAGDLGVAADQQDSSHRARGPSRPIPATAHTASVRRTPAHTIVYRGYRALSRAHGPPWRVARGRGRAAGLAR